MNEKRHFNFPLILEGMIWFFYVGCYKYSILLESAYLPRIPDNDFPYPTLCLFAVCVSLCLVPYYRWLVPLLLSKKKYLLLLAVSFFFLVVLNPVFQNAIAWIFEIFTRNKPLHQFFANRFHGYFLDWNLILTDTVAFLCIGFSRFSSIEERRRLLVETDLLQLQLAELKAQLKPHFLFNTLNSLYGMSLSGSAETPRFILLLSQMMQYILYDCNTEKVSLADEVAFLKGYFEIEQKKFPNAVIVFDVQERLPDMKIPPLLFLPLIENSFKHGSHRFDDGAGVRARLLMKQGVLELYIENECCSKLYSDSRVTTKGGIGLKNIAKRLELYYRDSYEMRVTENEKMYQVNLKVG